MRNSNKHMVQVSLSGETLPEEKFHVLGFVPIDIIGLAKDIWFAVWRSKQVSSADRFLSEAKRNDW
jgi:hypothetical protein